MLQPTNFYSALSPLYYCTKLIGLSPFAINKNGYKKSIVNICCSILLMIFLNSFTVNGLLRRPEVTLKFIEVVADIAAALLTQFNMASAILFGCIYSNTILRCVESINNFDRSIYQIRPDINLLHVYKNSKLYVMAGLILTTAFLTTVIGLSLLPELQDLNMLGEFMAYVAPEALGTFAEYQFCTLLLCLKQRFHWLNEAVILLSKSIDSELEMYNNIFTITLMENRRLAASPSVSHGLMQDSLLRFLEKIRKKHCDLYIISKNINKAYSIQILLIVSQNFVTVIVLTYYSGRHIVNETAEADYLQYCFIQIALAVVQTVAFAVVCSTTCREASKMGILLHNIALKHMRTKYKADIQIGKISTFALQLLHEDMKFTACDIFIVDETLLLSMAGAVTTYLVIVVQFELGDPSKLK